METRSKRKKKANAIPSPPPISPSSAADSTTISFSSSSANFRNWSDVPQDLLLLILHRLSLSVPDVLSFAAVCRSWRSAAASALAASPFCGPHLLFTPVLTHRRRRPRWDAPPHCRLQTLTNNPRSYRSIATSKTLRAKCVGCCYGHLIFDGGDKAVLANVFTGDKIRSPKFPETPSSPYAFWIGILTAPPSSPDCSLLFVAASCMLCWRLDSNVWAREEYLRYAQEVKSVAFFNGKLYCLDDKYHVKVVNYFDFLASWTTLELQLPNAPSLHGNFGKYLVECGGELLLVLFAGVTEYRCRIDVYRLDFERVKWEKMENLGDRCLFVDVAGNCPIVCSKPAGWGGRSNCVYVAGPGRDNWSVHPVDGSRIDAIDMGAALSSAYMEFSRWPSPIWVYPNKLL